MGFRTNSLPSHLLPQSPSHVGLMHVAQRLFFWTWIQCLFGTCLIFVTIGVIPEHCFHECNNWWESWTFVHEPGWYPEKSGRGTGSWGLSCSIVFDCWLIVIHSCRSNARSNPNACAQFALLGAQELPRFRCGISVSGRNIIFRNWQQHQFEIDWEVDMQWSFHWCLNHGWTKYYKCACLLRASRDLLIFSISCSCYSFEILVNDSWLWFKEVLVPDSARSCCTPSEGQAWYAFEMPSKQCFVRSHQRTAGRIRCPFLPLNTKGTEDT